MRYYFAAFQATQTVAFSGLGVLSPNAMLAVLRDSDPQPDQLDDVPPDRWVDLFVRFFESLARAVAQADPVERRLSKRAEDALNRHCYILGCWKPSAAAAPP